MEDIAHGLLYEDALNRSCNHSSILLWQILLHLAADEVYKTRHSLSPLVWDLLGLGY